MTAHSDLLELLQPVLATVARMPVRDATDDAAADRIRQALQAELPFATAPIQAIADAIRSGIADGTLCDRGEPDARFCRVAKATDATHGLSVDLVALRGPALRHRHPAGEVTLAFAGPSDGSSDGPSDGPADGRSEPRFDGHAPGWVVMAAGSTHTPTVDGAMMHLLYFLPDGQVDWNPAD
jgi:hypothetical protein